ncbi:iron-containing alcohol dehydrogenase [Evtepia sp.]|uniref:iron-containing alcohol dehydrogenase n=1 Tax=Evtepia sp. TaxID=2773933 RepID=UPI003F1783B8
MSFSFHVPTNFVFGQGSIQKLHKQRLPGKKAMIVISSGKSTRANGYLDTVQDQLTQAGVEYAVFDKILANPVIANVMDGAVFGRENGCDFVIGLGGGSSIDAAKAIAMMIPNEGNYWDYIYGGTGGGQRMKNKPLPIVAIPTTAGTGTELDAWTIITNEETNEKMSGGNKNTFPVLAIVDPDFMLSVPPKFTAYQGFDALFHSAESYINKTNNLMRDMIALKAIECVGRNLATACTDGGNVKAREQVAFGSSLGGLVMSVDNLCSEHSMEHPLSAYHPEIAHGAGLIMISRAYYTHMVENCPELKDRFVDMAKALGKADASEAMDFVTALVDLQKACGVDELKMSDYGITPDEFPKFAANARSTMGILFKMDRIQLSDEDLVKIYTESYK